MRFHRLAPLVLLPLVAVACSDGNDDGSGSPSAITVIATAAPEGAAGTMGALTFRVVLDRPQSTPTRVDYRTVAGTATAGTDYLDTEGRLTIPAGALAGTIQVDLIGDADEESGETFTLEYRARGNVTATSDSALGTIANDDSTCDEPFSNDPNPWIIKEGDPLNFAHRGGVIDFPENTLYAYAEAARAGADVLEMDVYQTQDNELVILHDLTVDRTTNGTGRVADLTLAELRTLDAAYWFISGEGTRRNRAAEEYSFRGIATGERPPPPGYAPEDFRIPTLEEALARFPHELINLELKPDLDGEGNYEQQMAELLQRYGRRDDVIAASFVDEAAFNFKDVAPCIYTSVPLDQAVGIGFAYFAGAPMPEVPEHITWQVPPDTSQISQLPDDLFLNVVTPKFVADSHSVNLAVQVWTINSCEEMLEMIAAGVDAIMTDRPILLEEILNTPAAERSCD